MKKLMILSCLFSVALFGRDYNMYSDTYSAEALKRANQQYDECIAARGENNRAECLEEYKSLVACINDEVIRRQNFLHQKINVAEKYKQLMNRIGKQYQECLRARGSNRKQECMSERARLIKNADKECETAQFDESAYQRSIENQFREDRYYRNMKEQADHRTAEETAIREYQEVADRLARRTYWQYWTSGWGK